MMEENGLKKGPWTSEEDRKLVEGVQKHGHGSWKEVAKAAGLNRCGKSCRLRWMNYLRPDIKRGAFTCEEETAIIDLHAQLGNKWSVIARYLPGRTDNEIKNFWNSRLKKKLFMNGMDPNTHTHLDNTCLMLPQQPQLLGYCNTSKHDLTWESHEEAIAAHVARILLLGNILQFLISSATPVLPLEASSPTPAATNGPRWERPDQIEALTCLQQPSFHNCTNVMEINTTNSQGFGEYYSSTHYEATTSAAALEDHILMDEQPNNYYWNL